MSMSLLLGLAAVLVLVVLILMFRVQGLLSIVRGSDKNPSGLMNRFNALMFLLFCVIGTGLFIYYSITRFDLYNLPDAVSEHGIKTDRLFWITTGVISIVFIVVNTLLMVFAFKYQYNKDRKATFYPDNHKLELAWTVIPAIVLTYLVITGWSVWSKTMEAPPVEMQANKIELEVVGQQFAWSVRYPGSDKVLGEHYFKNIDADNSFGLKVTDKNSWDDFLPREIVLAKGRKVHFVIRAKDVLHSVFLPHFRVKMDAMPGHPTEFWFTPTKTTMEIRSELDNQEFDYELACTEMCGKGHYSMRYIVKVLENDDYEKWLKESHKSSWALENGVYVLKTLYKQGAPAKTIAEFADWIFTKDGEKAKTIMSDYAKYLGEKGNEKESSSFISALANSKKGTLSSFESAKTSSAQTIVSDTNSSDTTNVKSETVTEDKSNLLIKLGDKVEEHKENKAEKNGEKYEKKDNVLHKVGGK